MIDKKHWQAAQRAEYSNNIIEIVLLLEEALQEIRDESHKLSKGVEWINTHPICVLFCAQIERLTKVNDPFIYDNAYEAANDTLIEMEEPAP
jgi:hypothetical protein